jgi:virulence factor
MQMKKIRCAVIGTGYLGKFHAEKYASLPDCELVAVVDIKADAAKAVADKHGARALTDYQALLGEVDAVSIVVPTTLHHSVSKDFLNAGTHVLVEKPITVTVAEADELIAIARAKNLILQVGHLERFYPAVMGLDKDEKPLFIESHRLSPFNPRANDVSVVLDLMIHDIDLLLELAASPVVKLTASGTRSLDSGYLDYVTATLGFANGVVATLTASKVTHRKIRRLVAHCKNSFTEADFLTNEILVHRQTSINPLIDHQKVLYRQDGLIEKVYTSNVQPLSAELEHFVNCVRGGNQPSVGGEQALKALRLASLIWQMALEERVWNPLEWSSESRVQSLTSSI